MLTRFPWILSCCVLLLYGCLGGEDDDLQPVVCEDGLVSAAEFAAADSLDYTELDDTGLLYSIVETGSDTVPTLTDSLRVAYVGAVTNGRIFDGRTPEDPAGFRLQNVIPGWQLGVPLIGEGGQIRLVIPSELAYGTQTRRNQIGQIVICPNSDLIFDIELLEIVEE
jgi:FKBP-type peptidyl-prolyl cis-trans isomerase